MKKYIYTLIILGFANLSFAQGNYELNTDDSNMVEDTSTGFLEIDLCVSQGIYNLKPVLTNLNDPSEVIPSDLEYRLIPLSNAAPLQNDAFFDSIDLNLDNLRIYLGMTGNQRRSIQFRIEIRDYPVGDPYYQYRLWDRIFVITLSNDQSITGAAFQDITTNCGLQATVRSISTNSSYPFITYYNSLGQIIPSNTQINPGDVITMYPRFSALMGDSSPGGTCDIPGFQVTIGTVTENGPTTYVGPELGDTYQDINVCDIDDLIQIPLISDDINFPLDPSDGTYRLRRSGSSGFINLTDPVFNTDGSFSHFSLDLTSIYSSGSTIDASFRVEYIPSNPTDGDGNPIQLCSNIYSNYFFIDITNEFANVTRSLDRVYFTNGLNDLDYDGIQEDELTYKAMYNLFLLGQQGLFNNESLIATPDVQGFLQYTGYTYTMFKDDGTGSIIPIASSDYDNIVEEFNDLIENCDEIFYFKISSNCDDYHFENSSEEYKTLNIRIRDLITTYTNPDQYFCSADNPTFESLQLLAEGTGNPIYVYGSEFAEVPIYDPTESTNGNDPLQDGDEYWIQEFGYPNAVCTNNYAEMFSSQRFYVQVHIVNNCSPETAECPCNSFELERGDKYIVSAWVKEDHVEQVMTYETAKLDLVFLEGDEVEEEFSFSPTGEIIEGWQRIVGEFFVPITATKVRIDLNNTDGDIIGPGPVDLDPYFDPYIAVFPPILREYDVFFLNDNFSNCDQLLTTTMRIQSNEELLPDTVYRLTPLTTDPLENVYIMVSNPTVVPFSRSRTIEGVANISCNQLSQLFNGGSNERVDVFYDDIRIHPFNGNMKSFVYDPITQRLMAELDENNYATMYEYDEEGGLIRVKKETEKGVFTIQETRSKSATKN